MKLFCSHAATRMDLNKRNDGEKALLASRIIQTYPSGEYSRLKTPPWKLFPDLLLVTYSIMIENTRNISLYQRFKILLKM